MGVVYKINHDLIEFILENKQQDPYLSCRKLVDIIWHKFQLKVSKSSINQVLKTASLSSPVGRRAGGDKSLIKFKIPDHKKKGLFTFPPESAVFEKNQTLGALSSKKDKGSPLAKPKKLVKSEGEHKDVPSSLMSNLENFDNKSGLHQDFSMVEPKDQGNLFDGMGAIFFKAAEWELSDTPLIGNLIKDHVDGGIFSDLDKVGNLLTFLQLFKIQDIKDLNSYRQHSLWALNEVVTPLDMQAITHFIANMHNGKDLAVKMSFLIDQLACEINNIEVDLQDGSSYWMDAHFSSVYSNNVQTTCAFPLSKGISQLTNKLLNNVQTMVLCGVQNSGALPEAVSSFISSFDNLDSKKIKYIKVYDAAGAEVLSIDSIPNKERKFIIGLHPWNEAFHRILSQITLSKEIFLKNPNWEAPCIGVDGFFNLQMGCVENMRIIYVKSQGSLSWDLALLTNYRNTDAINMEDVVNRYLMVWGGLKDGYHSNALSYMHSFQNENKDIQPSAYVSNYNYDITHLFPIEYNIFLALEKYIELINQYCLRHYFPGGLLENNTTDFIATIYSSKGYLKITDQAIKVTFDTKNMSNILKKYIEMAIKNINEREIFDFSGKKLILRKL